MRRLIYTTNVIESYHRELWKVTKSKSNFPSDEVLQKMMTMVVLKKWIGRVQNWRQILAQLSVYYQDRIKNYIC